MTLQNSKHSSRHLLNGTTWSRPNQLFQRCQTETARRQRGDSKVRESKRPFLRDDLFFYFACEAPTKQTLDTFLPSFWLPHNVSTLFLSFLLTLRKFPFFFPLLSLLPPSFFFSTSPNLLFVFFFASSLSFNWNLNRCMECYGFQFCLLKARLFLTSIKLFQIKLICVCFGFKSPKDGLVADPSMAYQIGSQGGGSLDRRSKSKLINHIHRL